MNDAEREVIDRRRLGKPLSAEQSKTYDAFLVRQVASILPHHQEESAMGSLAGLCLRLAERVGMLELSASGKASTLAAAGLDEAAEKPEMISVSENSDGQGR